MLPARRRDRPAVPQGPSCATGTAGPDGPRAHRSYRATGAPGHLSNRPAGPMVRPGRRPNGRHRPCGTQGPAARRDPKALSESPPQGNRSTEPLPTVPRVRPGYRPRRPAGSTGLRPDGRHRPAGPRVQLSPAHRPTGPEGRSDQWAAGTDCPPVRRSTRLDRPAELSARSGRPPPGTPALQRYQGPTPDHHLQRGFDVVARHGGSRLSAAATGPTHGLVEARGVRRTTVTVRGP